MDVLGFRPWPHIKRGTVSIYKLVHGSYVITTPSGRAFLFDGGYLGQGEYIRRFVRGYLGSSRLDGVFVSHFHQDHIGGIVDLLELERERFPRLYTAGVYFLPEGLGGVEAVPLQERMDALVTRYGVEHQFVSHGDVIPDPDVTITVMTPLPSQMPGEPPVQIPGTNGAPALSVLLEWGDARIWMVGDQPSWNALESALSTMSDTNMTVFQVPHHGDPNYISVEFMQNLDPKLSLLGERSYADATKGILDGLGMPWIALGDGPFEVNVSEDGSFATHQNHFPKTFRYAGWMHDPEIR